MRESIIPHCGRIQPKLFPEGKVLKERASFTYGEDNWQ